MMLAASHVNVKAVASNAIVIVTAIGIVLAFFSKYVINPIKRVLDTVEKNTTDTKTLSEAFPTILEWRLTVDEHLKAIDMSHRELSHRLDIMGAKR